MKIIHSSPYFVLLNTYNFFQENGEKNFDMKYISHSDHAKIPYTCIITMWLPCGR